MREMVEMMAGRSFSDEEWRVQVEAASGHSGADVPNGIENWLETLPVGDDGDAPKSVLVRWR